VTSYPIVRYRWNREVAYGQVVDGVVRRLSSDSGAQRVPGPPVASLDQVELLVPCQPTKIVAVGLNYADHAAEAGLEVPAEPLLFLKPPSTIIGPGAAIVYPRDLSRRVDYEAELAVVVGRRAHRVAPQAALDFVQGYTCANDVTARDLQRRDGQWTRAKGFDTFCPLGPWIIADLDTSNLTLRCRVNGELRQEGCTKDMLFPVAELIAHVSAVMTLEAGDVILTGTPAGIGPLQPGDRVAIEIEDIGELVNEVVAR
jgi:2-keto-4-pentenoate hydratase/2-oxohepta-3-ene-1,7-dioic acid hydratase in catechol pathway